MGGCVSGRGQLGYDGLGSYDLVSHGYIDLGPEGQEDIGPGSELDEAYLLSGLELLVVFGVADHPAGEEPGYLAAEHLGSVRAKSPAIWRQSTSVPSSFRNAMVVLSFLVEDLECQAAR